MKVPRLLFVTVLMGVLVACSSSLPTEQVGTDAQATEKFYEGMLNGENPNRAMLNLFLTKMPKGGDLHHHYSGTIYAETYLDWVKQMGDGWGINSCTTGIMKPGDAPNEGCEIRTVDNVREDGPFYTKLLSSWSDKDFNNHFHIQPPPDVNFFNTFSLFNPVAGEFDSTGFEILKQRALNENVSYIETMIGRVGGKSSTYYPTVDDIKDADSTGVPLEKRYDTDRDKIDSALWMADTQDAVDTVLDQVWVDLAKDSRFTGLISDFVAKLKSDSAGINDDRFVLAFQVHTVRILPPLQVFINMMAGYLAVGQSENIVGVNIVGPENNLTALRDYTLHMRMFNYLSRKLPDVDRALHAGELTLGMVRPKDLGFHIEEAIDIAGAQRIGHGVDITYERDSVETLEKLKSLGIAVEINLTSNEFILGVAYEDHPYTVYAGYGVPLVISTDDSGVSRNNLTNEYVLLASRYHPSYETLKEYAYNSIKFSFLPQVNKDTLKTDLDKRFDTFEKEMVALEGKIKN